MPPGCTSLVQPLNVSFNVLLMKHVENAAIQHMQENLESYVSRKFSASERRIMLTKWIVEAWETLSPNKEMAICSFKKCGISTAADRSEDFEINIKGLDNYVAPVFESLVDGTESDDDPFGDLSFESEGSATSIDSANNSSLSLSDDEN